MLVTGIVRQFTYLPPFPCRVIFENGSPPSHEADKLKSRKLKPIFQLWKEKLLCIAPKSPQALQIDELYRFRRRKFHPPPSQVDRSCSFASRGGHSMLQILKLCGFNNNQEAITDATLVGSHKLTHINDSANFAHPLSVCIKPCIWGNHDHTSPRRQLLALPFQLQRD